MGTLIRELDWSKTALGPTSEWPQSLRTSVSICLNSRFPTVIYWGPQFATIYNDGYVPILGTKHPWALGRPIHDVWSEIWNVVEPMMNGVISTGVATWSEDQLLNMNRKGYLEECYFTFSFAPVTIESGATGGIFTCVTETTERVLAERRLRTLRELGEAVSDSRTVEEACEAAARLLDLKVEDVPFTFVYLLDPDGKPALTSTSGIQPGQIASALAVDDCVDWPLAKVARTGAEELVTDLPKRFGEMSGGAWPESARAALVLPIARPGQDRPHGLLVAGVSPRRELDEDYRTFFKLVASQIASALGSARAYQDERKRAEALAEIDRAKTEFFSNVSHEFRTPLTLMLGPIEDALGSRDKVLSGEPLEMVHRNALRLMKLVNSLLDFSQIEADRVQACYQPSNLAAMTVDLASTFRSVVERTGLRLEVDCPALPASIYVDHEMWEKIVFNLLSNALKFTFEGSIAVSLRPLGDNVELTIRDTGTGIAAHELPHLFERFHRVRGAKSRTHEGSGIGLALVHELVRLHGGTIRVVSTLNEGTTFTVSIPQGSAHLPPERIGLERATTSSVGSAAPFVEEALRWSSGLESGRVEPRAAPATQRQPRVLLVDDNADLRDYITGLLSPWYIVEAAGDGIAALDAARICKPDIVLSDVMMPRLDGFGLLRALRDDVTTREVPIILLSARAGEESAIEGFEAGADDYLIKPFSARELLARVRTHVELARMRRSWAQELEQRSAELAATNRELEAFSYSVSHDLRAPLRAINGYANVLGEDHGDKLDAEGRRILGIIKKGGIRMGRLIDDLLAFSRLGRTPITKRRVDMAVLVRTVFEELHGKENDREVELTVQALPAARADRAMIQQVWTNLLSNALKYSSTRPKSAIEVGVKADADALVYFVKDNGVGFDMQYADKLFGVFQRLHSSAQFEGTGVGLALVDRIVRRHGGRVWAEGTVDAGATFYFSLPELAEVQDATQ